MTVSRDVIQKAHRAQVIVVSPNILMLAINTIQTVMRDARMREQADLIQQGSGRAAERREAAGRAGGAICRRHFDQAERARRHQGTSSISTDKIIGRGREKASKQVRSLAPAGVQRRSH